MSQPPGPLPCPRCGERQNAYSGTFDADAEPFGSFRCIVCNHQFSGEEYRAAIAETTTVVPFPK